MQEGGHGHPEEIQFGRVSIGGGVGWVKSGAKMSSCRSYFRYYMRHYKKGVEESRNFLQYYRGDGRYHDRLRG